MNKRRWITWMMYLNLVGMGLNVPLIGVTASVLAERFGLPLENAGLFSTVMSLGVAAGAGALSRLYDRWNLRHILPLGPAIGVTGMIALYFAPSLGLGIAAALLAGFGFGTNLLGPNIAIARLHPEGAGGALNLLNIFYGLGAIIAPQFVTLAAWLGDLRLTYLFGAASLTLIGLLLAATVNLEPPKTDFTSEAAGRIDLASLVLTLPFIILLFCGIGAEIGFNAWVVPQLQLRASASLEIATLGASLFWVGMTAGRILGWQLSRFFDEEGLLLAAISMIGLGSLLIVVFYASIPAGLIAAFLVGVGCGPIFPTVTALVGRAFGARFGQVGGLIQAVANFGPLILVWTQGRIGGGRDGGMIQVLALALVMALTTFYLLREKSRISRPPATVLDSGD